MWHHKCKLAIKKAPLWCIKDDRLVKLATMWIFWEATCFHGCKSCEIVHKASEFFFYHKTGTRMEKTCLSSRIKIVKSQIWENMNSEVVFLLVTSFPKFWVAYNYNATFKVICQKKGFTFKNPVKALIRRTKPVTVSILQNDSFFDINSPEQSWKKSNILKSGKGLTGIFKTCNDQR